MFALPFSCFVKEDVFVFLYFLLSIIQLPTAIFWETKAAHDRFWRIWRKSIKWFRVGTCHNSFGEEKSADAKAHWYENFITQSASTSASFSNIVILRVGWRSILFNHLNRSLYKQQNITRIFSASTIVLDGFCLLLLLVVGQSSAFTWQWNLPNSSQRDFFLLFTQFLWRRKCEWWQKLTAVRPERSSGGTSVGLEETCVFQHCRVARPVEMRLGQSRWISLTDCVICMCSAPRSISGL